MTQEHPGSDAQTSLVKLRIPGQNEHLLLVTEASTWWTLETGSDLYVTSEICVEVWYVGGPLHDASWKVRPIAKFTGKTLGDDGVKLTSGYVRIEPAELQGCGLGSYLFAKIVRWAKQLSPNTAVERIRLSPNQATDVASRDRRNVFYEKFGFTFDYLTFEGLERAGGMSRPMTVADLVLPVPQSEPRMHKPKGVIEDIDLPSFMQGAQTEVTRLKQKLEAQISHNTQLRVHLRSQRRRADAWRTRCWWAVGLIAIAAAVAFLAWHRSFVS